MQIQEINEPLLTISHDSLRELHLKDSSVYLYSELEERSMLPSELVALNPSTTFFRVNLSSDESSFVSSGLSDEGNIVTTSLRSSKNLDNYFINLGSENVYIDITGLPHKLWMPLVKSALGLGIILKVVYSEPKNYKPNPSPVFSDLFDLSERIDGIAPIPTLASFYDARDENTVFIPMLSFEGARFSYLVSQVQPLSSKIYPIIGVPGFQLEYPFYTYMGNNVTLKETEAWKKVQYATANCPFSAFCIINEIQKQNSGDYVKIAPTGTKPLALGGLLYLLKNTDNTEIIYDHPKRKSNRSDGYGQCYVYRVSDFMKGIKS